MELKRRTFLEGCLGTLALSRFAQSQASYPGVSYRPYHRCLPEYMRGLARQAYERRESRLASVRDAQSLAGYQSWVRETFWELVGGKPVRTPLNARVTGSFERPGYRVEKILYESRPGFHIGGNLYVPTVGEAPFPGILFQMGHSLNGKANAGYQRCCQGLVQSGFVVLAFDPMGQGERTYYPGDDGYLTRFGSADDEHTYPGRQMILVGDTSTSLQVWDAVRSLDYLASHPSVDPERLGSTGQSGGGTLTMLLAAVDDRLAAAVVSCGNTENFACLDFVPPGSTDDAEQNLLHSGPMGFDRWDLLYPLAPKPLLVLVSARDWFGTYSPKYLSSGWSEYQKLFRIYEMMGTSEHLSWGDTPLPHNLSYSFRLATYTWFSRWLKDAPEGFEVEPPTRVEEDRTLWIGSTGNLVRDFSGETPASLARRRLLTLPGPPSAPELRALLSVGEIPAQPEVRSFGTEGFKDVTMEALEVEGEPPIWLPAWLFKPTPPRKAERLLLLLEPPGRSLRWREDDLYQRLAARGVAVCAPDIRWIGDLRPEFSPGARNHASWHQDEEAWSWASLILGRPLLGQRVADLLALVRALKSFSGTQGLSLRVAARGELTVPALCAAHLLPEIDALLLSGGLLSFRSVVEASDYRHPMGNFVFGILGHTDLPALASGLGGRPLTLAATVGPMGETLPAERVRETYRGTSSLRVVSEEAWDLQSLLDL